MQNNTQQMTIHSHPEFTHSTNEMVKKILQSGVLSGVHAPVRQAFEKQWAQFMELDYVFAVNSGTGAIHMALLAMGIGAGDGVITTAFSFSGSLHPILAVEAEPQFVDIRRDNFCIDHTKIEDAITATTKAILVVHIHGHACDMDAIMDIAERHNLFVIEDCAQAHGTTFNGQKVGTFGEIACWSLNQTKILPAGEGGIVATKSRRYGERLEAIRVFGEYGASHPNRSYDVDRFGLNYLLQEIPAAIAMDGMTKLAHRTSTAYMNATYMNELLSDCVDVQTPNVQPHEAIQKYRLLFRAYLDRDVIFRRLLAEGLYICHWQRLPMPHYSIFKGRYLTQFYDTTYVLNHSIVIFDEKHPIWAQSPGTVKTYAKIIKEIVSS